MTRTFWMAVGALGGIAAYRKSLQVATKAKELGPLGSAQAIASGTSRAAGRTANGLGRLHEARERRAGRLLTGSAQDRSPLPGGPAAAAPRIPDGWSVVPEDLGGPGSAQPGSTPPGPTPDGPQAGSR